MFQLGQSEPKEFNYGTSAGTLGRYILGGAGLPPMDKVAEKGGCCTHCCWQPSCSRRRVTSGEDTLLGESSAGKCVKKNF